MRNLSAWIPSLNSWMSAVLLILLMKGVSVLINIVIKLGDPWLVLPPNWKIVVYILTLLSPILIITVAHHLLQIILERYFPNTRLPEMTDNPGFFPSLMSWWEGIYGWQVFTLAVLISEAIRAIFFYSSSSFYELLSWWDELKDLFTLTSLIRLVSLAYLYQFEQAVRQHLISVGSNSQSNQS